jgi:hypothetical protein
MVISIPVVGVQSLLYQGSGLALSCIDIHAGQNSSVLQRCFDGTSHGFYPFTGAIDAGREGVMTIASYLCQQLHA